MSQQSTIPPVNSPVQSTPPTETHPAPANDADDPLVSLYRMSRTAGLGSGDYVAINVLVVTGVIFGLASALVVVDPLFLVLPIVGLILAIVGIFQIRNSNGTQSGFIIGILALLLSLGFLTFKVGGQVMQGLKTAHDRNELEQLLSSMGDDLKQGDEKSLADAYTKLDSSFTGRVPLQKFDAVWDGARQSPYFGPISSMQSNGQFIFDVDPRTAEPIARGFAIVTLQKGAARDAPRWDIAFRKEGGKWLIDGMPDIFPAEPPAPAKK